MFQDDYIMRQIEMLTRFISNVLLQGDTTDTSISVDEEGYIEESDFLSYRLNGLLLEGKINEAENLLFEAIEESPKRVYLKTAMDFYETLGSLSDEQLERGDFSRDEIVEGLQAVCDRYVDMGD